MKNKNRDNQGFFMKGNMFGFFFMCLITFLVFKSLQAQEFVHLENGGFKKGCDDFFPLIVSYSLEVIQDSEGNYHAAPVKSYCSPSRKPPAWFSCGRNNRDWKQEMSAHFLKIAQMGFNVVRLTGLEIDCKRDDSIWDLISKKISRQSCSHCYEELPGYRINKEGIRRQGDMFEEVLEVIREHNARYPSKPLMAMILTGTSGYTLVPAQYLNYLDYLSKRFAGESLIFSWEIMSEPFYLGPPDPVSKEDAAGFFASLYKVVRKNAPSQLITMGLVPGDVYQWDSNIIPADFISFHLYTDPGRAYNPAEYERYQSNLYWFSQTCKIPWIIGETGLPANDAVHVSPIGFSYLVASEIEQRDFAVASVKHSIGYGAAGYTWWQYKDIPWYSADTAGIWHNYFGLIHLNDKDEREKPVADVFRHLDIMDTGVFHEAPDPDTYFNLDGGEHLIMEGTLTTADGQPLQNAFITAQCKTKNFRAYSDENGHYSIYANGDTSEFKIVTVQVSYPGKVSVTKGKWTGKPLPVPQDICLYDLDPGRLPPMPGSMDLILEKGEHIIWNFEAALIQDKLIIRNGASLTVTDTLYMNTGGNIVVEAGGTLTVDCGFITTRCGNWKGVELIEATNTGLPSGRLELVNGGKVDGETRWQRW